MSTFAWNCPEAYIAVTHFEGKCLWVSVERKVFCMYALRCTLRTYDEFHENRGCTKLGEHITSYYWAYYLKGFLYRDKIEIKAPY